MSSTFVSANVRNQCKVLVGSEKNTLFCMAHLAYSGDDEPLAALAFAVLEWFWWGGQEGKAPGP